MRTTNRTIFSKQMMMAATATAILALGLLLSACIANPTATQAAPTQAAPTQAAPTQAGLFPSEAPTVAAATQAAPTQATATPVVQTQTVPVTATPAQGTTFDYSGIAQSVSAETVPAVAESAGGPYWDVMPQYTRLTLEGYPITNHLMKPQIFIYPAADLAGANAGAGQIAADLQTLLQNQQVGKNLPFLPLFNASQVMHAQVKFIDFKNGKGVSYLTQFDQAPLPINNHELIYTFQGLTSDGKFYVAAVLPVNHPSLPADEKVTQQQGDDLMKDFPGYLATTTAALDQQPAASFTPDLSKLEAMIQSLEVK